MKNQKLPINKIIHGDCVEVMKKWSKDTKCIILTDPPYGINYDKHQGSRPNEKKKRKMIGDDSEIDLGFLLKRPELKIIFGAQNFLKQLPNLGRWLCWDKRGTSRLDKMLGSPFELAWINKKSGYYKMYRILHAGAVNADAQNRNVPRYHPTQKPIRLMEAIIRDFTKKGDIILDPFVGSGTTCIAAKLSGRKWIGIEIDKEYCKIAKERIKKIKLNFIQRHLNENNQS